MSNQFSGCVYRPVVTPAKSGKQKKRRGRYYWVKYSDEDGLEHRHVLKAAKGMRVSDKEVAKVELRKLLARLERQAAGLIDPLTESAGIPMRTVMARYLKHLRALRRSRIHVSKSKARLRWLSENGPIVRLADVIPANVCRALDKLAGAGTAPKTINDYRAAIFGMCQWAIKVARWLDRNPIETVPVRRREDDLRKVRRALTPIEAGKLLSVSGLRALWYETALFTGLRVSELRSLRWADVDLQAVQPCLHLRADATKSRREDFIPIKATLAGKLEALKPPFAKSGDSVFRSTPTLETFRRDCERAGIDWGPDDQGRTLDRHALRTTFVSWLSLSGVEPRTAQQLARHTDIQLTMKTYTDPRLINVAAAIEKLPTLDVPTQESMRATGTDDRFVVPRVVPTPDASCHSASSQGKNRDKVKSTQTTDMARVGDERHHVSPTSDNGGGGNRIPCPPAS